MRHLLLLATAFFLLCAGSAVPPLADAADAPPAPNSPTLDRIKRTGVITFAYREGAAPFSFKDRGGVVRGYSVELCTRVAAAIQKDLGLPSLRIEWLPVDAASRIGVVASGKADAVCGTTTVTLTRMQSVDFSVPIFVDGGGILVQSKSKLTRLTDLKGKKIAVIGGTTTERALKRALDVIDASATLVPVKDGTAGMASLAQGQVDGYAGDRIVLLDLRMAAPNAVEFDFVDGDFSVEPYALVLPRNDADFRLAVNRALVALFRSGDIDPIFQRWLGGMGRPGPLLHALFYLNTLPE
jgi:ABC-type amino acid transport substrate-binding protein